MVSWCLNAETGGDKMAADYAASLKMDFQSTTTQDRNVPWKPICNFVLRVDYHIVY